MCRLTALLIAGLFFIVVSPLPGFAQGDIFGGYEKRRDSAIGELHKYPLPDTARVNALAGVYLQANFLKRKKELKPYCEEALRISRQLSYPKGLAETYLFIGNYNRSAGNSAIAINYFDSVLLIAHYESTFFFTDIAAQANRWKGVLYLAQEQYEEALNSYFAALKYYEPNPSFSTQYIYQDIAIIYQRLASPDQAILYAKKQVALAEEKFPGIAAVSAYLSLVEIYLQKKDLAASASYLDKSRPFIPDSEESMLNISYYTSRGQLHLLQGRTDSAYHYFQLAYLAAKEIDHNESIMIALNNLSILALKRGDIPLAKKYALENESLAEEANSKISLIAALQNLSAVYSSSGNKKEAFTLLSQATALKDSILSETNLRQANILSAIYETEKKQKEIASLQLEKKIEATAIQRDAFLNAIFVVTIAGMLIFAWLAWTAVNRGRKIYRQEQEISQQKIRALESEQQLITADGVLKAQEEERGRIAKDLNDGLGGLLSGVKFSFLNMEERLVLPAKEKISFDWSIQMLDNTITELRQVAHNLMPETLLRFGLEISLQEFCRSIQTSTGIKVTYQQKGESRSLAKKHQITIYRIVQELINNALKHAAASTISVQLSQASSNTKITVEDNGKGFDTLLLNTKKGAGIRNIIDRVNYCKGNVDIHSKPGNGTVVRIDLVA